ncbi:MAG: hypothetical protein AAFQ74_10115 [Cyanobacteria bacterium J06623_4]
MLAIDGRWRARTVDILLVRDLTYEIPVLSAFSMGMLCSKHVAQSMTYSIKVRNHYGRCLIRFKCPLTGKSVSRTFNDYNDPLQRYEAEGVALKIQEALNNHTWDGDWTPYLPQDVKSRNKPLIDALKQKAGTRRNCIELTVAKKLENCPPMKTPADLKRWLDKQTCKNSSRNRYRTAICAVRPDLCEGTKKLKENKTQPDPWEEHEREAICSAFEGTKYEYYVWGLFKTGMRPGEFKALLPADFTKNRKGYMVRVTKGITKNGAKDSTKTGKERLVPMHECDWLRLKQAVTENHEFYHRINDENFRKRTWYPALKKLGLKKKKPYTTRHTAITEYLCRGGSYNEAGRIFGNSGVTIEKSYAGFVGTMTPV